MGDSDVNAEPKRRFGRPTMPLPEISSNLSKYRPKGGEPPHDNGSTEDHGIKGDCADVHVFCANPFENISQHSASRTNPCDDDFEEPDTRSILNTHCVFEPCGMSPMPEINDHGVSWVEDEPWLMPPSPDWPLPFRPSQTHRGSGEFPLRTVAVRNSINGTPASRNVSPSRLSSGNPEILESDGPAFHTEETSLATNRSEPAVRLGDEGRLSVSANLPFGLCPAINRNVPCQRQILKSSIGDDIRESSP